MRSVAGQHCLLKIADESGKAVEIVNSKDATQVLETSHPPVYYFPKADVNLDLLQSFGKDFTRCEFKSGQAVYFDVVADGNVLSKQSAWMYVGGNDELIKDRIAFYLKTQNGMSATVDGEVVKPQEGDFYGGWIVPSKSAGPFKGGPGSRFW